MDKELDLAVTCYGKVKPLKYDLVLLPWGATEPHNLHLPYLTDCILSHDIALDAAKLAKTHYGIHFLHNKKHKFSTSYKSHSIISLHINQLPNNIF